jgi:hypothetical protein
MLMPTHTIAQHSLLSRVMAVQWTGCSSFRSARHPKRRTNGKRGSVPDAHQAAHAWGHRSGVRGRLTVSHNASRAFVLCRKTCLLLRYAHDSFRFVGVTHTVHVLTVPYSPTFITTIGIDFKIKYVDLDGIRTKLQIWDTGTDTLSTVCADTSCV